MDVIPAHIIIETVCKICDVTPHEFNTDKNKLKVIQCKTVIMAMLNRHTMKSDHQIAELLNTDVISVRNQSMRETTYIVGGYLETKIREAEININQLIANCFITVIG